MKACPNPSFGLLTALLAALCFSLMSFLVHWNPQRFPVEQMTFVRSLVTVLGVLPFCWRDLGKYLRSDAAMLWLRAFSGAAGLFCYFYTLQGTVSGNANFLFSSSPLFVSLLSFAFLGERLSKTELAGIALILVANFLLYLPNRSSMPIWVWQAGIAGALISSIAFLSLGSATRHYSSSLIVFGFGLMSVLFSLLFPGQPWGKAALADWGYLISIGVLGLAAQVLTTQSFAHLKSSVATSLGRTTVLFSGMLDITIAGYRPHWLEWTSYFVIIAGVVLTQEKKIGNRKGTEPSGFEI